MPINSQLLKYQDSLKALCQKDNLSFELYAYRKFHERSLFKKKDLQSSSSDIQHINLRVSKENQTGFSYTKSFSLESLKDCYKKAKDSLQFTDSFKAGTLSEKQKYQPEDLFYEDKKSSLKEQLEYTKQIHQASSTFNKKVQTITTAITKEEDSYFFINSKDSQATFKNSNIFIQNQCLGIDQTNRSESYNAKHFKNFSNLNPEEIGKYTAKLALQKLNYKIPETKKYPVIFKAETAGASLLSALTNFMSGKKVFENLSILKNSLYKKIFSNSLSIYDEPLAKWGSESQTFDGEGFACEKTPLVEKGVLKNFLTSSFYAKALKVPHTKKACWIEDIGLETSSSNLVMSKGESSFENMLTEFPKVIVIDHLKGWAGFNPISGDFSIESEGFLYEGTNLIQALAQFTVSGNILDIFKNILKIENTTHSSSSTKTSSFLVPDLMIVGK
ncbi:MAG: TldD/PmbA family protein [Bdellovibrionales bacterium]|nr:TldD/PmbA family protein [Bdellovibrionales bacterium]